MQLPSISVTKNHHVFLSIVKIDKQKLDTDVDLIALNRHGATFQTIFDFSNTKNLGIEIHLNGCSFKKNAFLIHQNSTNKFYEIGFQNPLDELEDYLNNMKNSLFSTFEKSSFHCHY